MSQNNWFSWHRRQRRKVGEVGHVEVGLWQGRRCVDPAIVRPTKDIRLTLIALGGGGGQLVESARVQTLF